LETHWTQEPLEGKQRGRFMGQLLSDAHCTHCWVVGSQMFADEGQSLAVLHPTQSPVFESQWGALRLHCASLVHAARHV
jgi:hypothetical protein